jgi:hypothetical protein
VDGKPSSEARSDYYCVEHACHKCGRREDADYCRNCECAAMSCFDERSTRYKKSAYCTDHTCPKCEVRPKDRTATRCAVC